jgi:uncharacterized membrane protein YdjX (TVP38/TMEM64 family)
MNDSEDDFEGTGADSMVRQRSKWGFVLKLLAAFAVIVLVGVAAKQFNGQGILQNVLLQVKAWGAAGAIAFIVVYGLATVLFLPGSILTLSGGALFGVVLGSVYVFVGAVLGSTLAFLVGRYVARGWVAERIAENRKFKAIDEAVAREGFKVVLLTRLSPVFPFNLLNYAFGITQVSLKDYLLGAIGMLPGTVTYVYIGSLAGSLATVGSGSQPANSQTQLAQWAIRVVGFLATIAVTVYVTRVARKALDQSVPSEESSHVPIDHS